MELAGETTATAPRQIEVLDIGLLARRFMRFERSMRLYRMVLAYMLLTAVFILPGTLLIVFAAARSQTPVVGVAAIVAVWAVLLALCYAFAYIYGRCMAGSRRAVTVLSVVSCSVFALSLAGLFFPDTTEDGAGKGGADAASGIGIMLMVILILGGLIEFLRTRNMPGAALIVDRNYTKGFHHARGLGRDLLRVMSIPTLPAQPIAIMLAITALAAFGLEGVVLNAYSQSLPAALGLVAGADATLRLVGATIIPAAAAIALLCMAVARRLRRRARRGAMLSAEAARQVDPRPPILFLRAFHDDQVSLAAARLPLLMRLIDPGGIGGTLEELIVQECTWLGPVVAIGDPSHPLPPLGVSRMYCSGDTWQESVNGLMQESALIVIVVDSSAAIGPDGVPTGLAWEITRLRDKGVLGKTTFVWPPQDARADDALERLLRLIDPAGQIARPAIAGACLALCMRSSGDALLLTAQHVSEVEYTLALRAPRLVEQRA
jgi:hypothetical protein